MRTYIGSMNNLFEFLKECHSEIGYWEAGLYFNYVNGKQHYKSLSDIQLMKFKLMLFIIKRGLYKI